MIFHNGFKQSNVTNNYQNSKIPSHLHYETDHSNLPFQRFEKKMEYECILYFTISILIVVFNFIFINNKHLTTCPIKGRLILKSFKLSFVKLLPCSGYYT